MKSADVDVWTFNKIDRFWITALLTLALWFPNAADLWKHHWEVGERTYLIPVHLLLLVHDYVNLPSTGLVAVNTRAFRKTHLLYGMTLLVDAMTCVLQARHVHNKSDTESVYQMVILAALTFLALARFTALWATHTVDIIRPQEGEAMKATGGPLD